MVALLIVASGLGATAPAQTTSPTPPASARPAPMGDALLALPAATDALASFAIARHWLGAWEVPKEPQSIDPPGTRGACVTLRLGGEVIGRGSSLGADTQSIWRAVRAAWVEATARLPVERDLLRDEQLRELAPRVVLDLQLAGAMTPVLGDDEKTVAGAFSPGIDGLSARVGERSHAVFPGEMLSTNSTPVEALRAACAGLGLPPRALRELRSESGLVVYRFPALHAVQLAPGAEPVFLHRGGSVVPANATSGAGLRSAAAALARHIASRRWPGEEAHGLLGDYHPQNDRYQPMLAEPVAQATAALAMARYAGVPELPAEVALASRKLAADVLAHLAIVTPDEPDPLADPVACALWLAARHSLAALPAPEAGVALPELGDGAFHAAARQRLLACVDDQGAWTVLAPTTSGRSAIAYALALEASAAPNDLDLLARARGAVALRFKEVDRARLVSEMPWLGWAALALPDAAGAPAPGAGSGPATAPALPGDIALREMRTLVWDHQLDERQAAGPSADLAGGVVFTRGGPRLPTWHTLRPLAFLASAIADRRLTDTSELRTELALLQRSLRFAIQLQAGDASLHMARDAKRTAGGVRAAPWDQTMPLEASALGLLCFSETLRAVHARSGG